MRPSLRLALPGPSCASREERGCTAHLPSSDLGPKSGSFSVVAQRRQRRPPRALPQSKLDTKTEGNSLPALEGADVARFCHVHGIDGNRCFALLTTPHLEEPKSGLPYCRDWAARHRHRHPVVGAVAEPLPTPSFPSSPAVATGSACLTHRRAAVSR